MSENTPIPKDTNLVDLPDDIIAKVISLTTPVDAFRMSVASPAFLSAADSDTVWNEFLPLDYVSMVSRLGGRPDLMSLPSKKKVFVSLCNNPILIDDRKKCFWLDKRSGKKCYMIAGRELSIFTEVTSEYFLISVPESRFDEAAGCRYLDWVKIEGDMDTSQLSPATTYIVYLVFKIETDDRDLEWYPSDVWLGVIGGKTSKSVICLDPIRRKDGWFEIEFGEYITGNAEAGGEILDWIITEDKKPCQIIVQGIEFRPKSG